MVPAEEKIMIIEVNPKTVFEEQNFSISVYDPSIQNATPYLINVTILFNENYYEITQFHENSELILIAPSVLTNKTFEINAYKENYKSSNTAVLIKPLPPSISNQLVITISNYSINANKEFTVLITDEYANPLNNVTVGIQSFSNEESVSKTDENGLATLIAPNINEITIIAQKQGYDDSLKKLWINTKPGLIENILRDNNTPIIIAFIILIIAIIFVSIKYSKKPKPKMNIKKPLLNNEIQAKKKILYYNTENEKSLKQIDLCKDSKIEEITIQKKPIKININKSNLNNEIIKKNGKNIYEFKKSWFDGKNDLRNKIDYITKESSLKNKKDWFEGQEEIFKKIDKKLKEIDKK